MKLTQVSSCVTLVLLTTNSLSSAVSTVSKAIGSLYADARGA